MLDCVYILLQPGFYLWIITEQSHPSVQPWAKQGPSRVPGLLKHIPRGIKVLLPFSGISLVVFVIGCAFWACPPVRKAQFLTHCSAFHLFSIDRFLSASFHSNGPLPVGHVDGKHLWERPFYTVANGIRREVCWVFLLTTGPNKQSSILPTVF